jgi:hypothetical protein
MMGVKKAVAMLALVLAGTAAQAQSARDYFNELTKLAGLTEWQTSMFVSTTRRIVRRFS